MKEKTNKLCDVSIPITIKSSNELKNIEFKFEYGATLISGKPGTGKTTIIRQLLAYMSNRKDEAFDVLLADTTGYEFSKTKDLPQNIIRDFLFGTIQNDIEEFIDKIYIEFIERKDFMIKNGCNNIEMLPEDKRKSPVVIIIDDIYILLDNLKSQEYLQKFEMLITVSRACGFQFVLLCQDYKKLREKLPMVLWKMIEQKICLSS